MFFHGQVSCANVVVLNCLTELWLKGHKLDKAVNNSPPSKLHSSLTTHKAQNHTTVWTSSINRYELSSCIVFALMKSCIMVRMIDEYLPTCAAILGFVGNYNLAKIICLE